MMTSIMYENTRYLTFVAHKVTTNSSDMCTGKECDPVRLMVMIYFSKFTHRE